jgi:protein disulfide-isomerase A6
VLADALFAPSPSVGFPTLKLFTPGKKAPEDYQGARSAKPMLDAVLAKLDAKNIKKLTAKSAEEFIADKALPKVLLFTSKPKSSHLYMALSMEYKGKLAFAEIQNKDTALSTLSLSSTPDVEELCTVVLSWCCCADQGSCACVTQPPSMT